MFLKFLLCLFFIADTFIETDIKQFAVDCFHKARKIIQRVMVLPIAFLFLFVISLTFIWRIGTGNVNEGPGEDREHCGGDS